MDDDPLAGLDRIDDGDMPPPTAPGDVPPRGCAATTDAVTVWPAAGPVDVVTTGAGFLVAGYAARKGSRELFVVRLEPGKAPSPLFRHPVEGARGAPELIAAPALGPPAGGKVPLAYVDGEGTVRVGTLPTVRPTRHVRWTEIGDGADPRFAPHLVRRGERTVAFFVRARDAGMDVRAVRLRQGRIDSRHDLAPDGMGATAPAPIAGSASPALVFADAREALSPILRAELRADGTPGRGKVARPVSNLFEPPDLAAVEIDAGTFLAYTAVGNGATTAVGLVRLDAEPGLGPEALVPGKGYGMLSVDGVALSDAALFAAAAPRGRSKDAAREVWLRQVDDAGLGPALEVTSPDGTAEAPSLARRDDGTVALAFRGKQAVFVQLVGCAGDAEASE